MSRLIDLDDSRNQYVGMDGEYEQWNIDPNVIAEQRWIPCSERLPKIGKEVLLSEPNDMFIAEYYGSGLPEGVWRVDGIDHYLQDIKGCAWMPLPEPYREEGENDEVD